MDKNRTPGRRFRAPVLECEMTGGAAFKAIARAALEQIAGNAEDLREAPHTEVVHQMRVGARRVRSVLSTFNPIVSDRRMEGIKAELKWLSGELDPARNLDVFISGAFQCASREKRQKIELAALGRRLSMARRTAYARARKAARSDRFSALLLDILAWVEDGPWTEADAEGAAPRDAPIGEFAAMALEKGRRQVKKRARRFDHLSREARHKLRIRAKTLRYGADVFDGLFKAHPKRARRFVGRIKLLLDRLGGLNDVATAERLIADHPAPSRLQNRQDLREKRLIHLTRKALNRFEAAKRFWPKKT